MSGGPFRSRAHFFLLAAFVCVGVFLVAFCRQHIIDGDYWWYLASGKVIAGGEFPDTNLFSFTNADYPWKFTQWLFACLLYVVESVAGPTMVEGLFLLVLCATFLLTLDTVRIKSGRIDLWLFLPLITLVIWASSFRFIIRPHIATLFFLALLLNLFEKKPRRGHYVFFSVAALWTNIHAGFFFGLVACCATVFADYCSRDRASLYFSAKATLWFFLGTLFNVNLLYPYYYVVSNLWVTKVVPVVEMANISVVFGNMGYVPFWTLMVVFLCSLFGLVKGRNYHTLFLLMAFFPLSLFAVRIIPKMLLLVLPGCFAALQGMLKKSRPAYFVAIVLLWGSVVGAYVALDRPAPVKGWGVSQREFPLDAADFIRNNSLSGEMYNGFDEGGYLAYRFYPERKVYIDSRIQAYPPSFFQQYYEANSMNRWGALMNAPPVDFALIRRQIVGDRETFNRGVFLEALGWPLIYMDGKYLIYARRGRGNDHVIARSQFMLVAPAASADVLKQRAKKNPVKMLSEIKRIPVHSLRLKADVLRFADAAFYAGDPALCERILRHGWDNLRESYGILLKLAALHAMQGKTEMAINELQSVVDVAEDTPIKAQVINMMNKIKASSQGGDVTPN